MAEEEGNEGPAGVGEVEEGGGELGQGKCEVRGPGEGLGWITGGPLNMTGEMTGGRQRLGTTEGAEVVVEELGEGEEEVGVEVEEVEVEVEALTTETETRRERKTSSEK